MLCLSELLLCYECRRQETAMGSEAVVEWPRRVRLREVYLGQVDVAPGEIRVGSQQKSSFRGDLDDGPVRPFNPPNEAMVPRTKCTVFRSPWATTIASSTLAGGACAAAISLNKNIFTNRSGGVVPPGRPRVLRPWLGGPPGTVPTAVSIASRPHGAWFLVVGYAAYPLRLWRCHS